MTEAKERERENRRQRLIAKQEKLFVELDETTRQTNIFQIM